MKLVKPCWRFYLARRATYNDLGAAEQTMRVRAEYKAAFGQPAKRLVTARHLPQRWRNFRRAAIFVLAFMASGCTTVAAFCRYLQ